MGRGTGHRTRGRCIGGAGVALALALTSCVVDSDPDPTADVTLPESTSTIATVAPSTSTTTTTSVTPSIEVTLEQMIGGSSTPDLDEGWMSAVTSTGSLLVAGGAYRPEGAPSVDAAVWTSSDGVVWERVDAPEQFGDISAAAPLDQTIRDIAAGSLGIVAVGVESDRSDSSAAVWISPDGVEWERVPNDARSLSGEGNQSMHAVAFLDDLAVVVGEAGGLAAAWVSDDGVEWTRAEINDESPDVPSQSMMRDVTVLGPSLVAIGAVGARSRPAVWLSADGWSWSRLPESMAGPRSGFAADEPTPGTMTDVAAGERGLVAVGLELLADEDPTEAARGILRPLVWASADGYEWELLDASFEVLPGDRATSPYTYLKRGSPVVLEDIAWDGERLIAVGGYELAPSGNAVPAFITLWTSIDGGITWRLAGEVTLEPTDSVRGPRALTLLGDMVVVVGFDDRAAGEHPQYGWMTYEPTAAVWLAPLAPG